MKMDHLGHTHSGRIYGGEHGFIFQVIRSIKKPVNFINRKYDREFVLYQHAQNRDIIPKNVKYISAKKNGWLNYKDSMWLPSDHCLFWQEESP